jgi:hypothetical protein
VICATMALINVRFSPRRHKGHEDHEEMPEGKIPLFSPCLLSGLRALCVFVVNRFLTVRRFVPLTVPS